MDTSEPAMDAPIDLSKGGKSSSQASSHTPDVIMLSDEEDDLPKLLDGLTGCGEEELLRTRKIIRRLQNELRNEETKLVLMKKIQQSQRLPPTAPPQKAPTAQVQPSNAATKPTQQPAQAHSNARPAHAGQSLLHRSSQLQQHQQSSGRSSSQLSQLANLSQQQQMSRSSSGSSVTPNPVI